MVLDGFDVWSTAAATSVAERLELVRRLPHPLHLLEFVFDSQHYHFGCYEDPGEPLSPCQDRLVLRGLRHLAPAAEVLDIGCGLGGTSRLLAERGYRVTAIDPSRASVAYARSRANGARRQVRFEALALESFAAAGARSFAGAIAIEVLQYFPDLEAFFRCCRALLAPGARLVLCDVVLEHAGADGLAWSHVPFHPRARMLAAAQRAGFHALEVEDLTRAARPTLASLGRELERRRADLRAGFGARPGAHSVEEELEELLFHVAALEQAFAHGHLGYQLAVLGCAQGAAGGAS